MRSARATPRNPQTPTPEGYGTPDEEAQVDAAREAAERDPTEEELEKLESKLDARGDLAIDTAPRTLTRPHGQNSDVVDADSDEPQGDVNLVSDSVVDASLFDQPSVEGDPHAPRVIADEMRALDEHEGTSIYLSSHAYRLRVSLRILPDMENLRLPGRAPRELTVPKFA